MKLLIVALPESVHTARWIKQLLDQGWTIYLFPSSYYMTPHELLSEVEDTRYAWTRILGGKLRRGRLHICGVPDFGIRLAKGRRLGNLIACLFARFFQFQEWHLRWVIRRFKPDLVHSLEFQRAGKLCVEAKDSLGWFPRWIATNWGSDVFLFGRLPWASQLVQSILGKCDVYSCECHRDIDLAKELGFRGKIWPVYPNTGGFDLEKIRSLRDSHRDDNRRLIMLKGYSNWSGRAIFAVEALKRCAALLKGYRIMVFSWNEETRVAMELAHQSHGLQYEIVPHQTSHEKILSLFARARAYIGVGISDGISTSCLEAMAMGAFPIQSRGACCAEWFRDQESGISVDAEDIDQIASAIRRALTDNELCMRAQSANDTIVRDRLDQKKIKTAVLSSYRASLSRDA